MGGSNQFLFLVLASDPSSMKSKSLKGVVPSPVLKSSLDSMALDKSSSNENQFYDSDEEEGKGSKAKEKKLLVLSSYDDLEGSLSLKPGRNANTSLYYVDYSKFPNDGNGLFPDDRNALLGEHEKVKADMDVYVSTLKDYTTKTEKLLSEPTNASADESVQMLGKEVDHLMEDVESAKEFQVNESHRKEVHKGIELMTSQWRKRKRLCMDFLITMEECTEGSISVAKCLKGDGPIELDSDETIIKGATSFSKQGRNRKRSHIGNKNSGVRPNPAFIGVLLNRQGKAERVYLDEE